jgi:hypothetical protein
MLLGLFIFSLNRGGSWEVYKIVEVLQQQFPISPKGRDTCSARITEHESIELLSRGIAFGKDEYCNTCH